jgi:steroid delta-isomerase-like uncharacterized protein
MSAQKNRLVIAKHFEAINARLFAQVAGELTTADAIWTNVAAGATFRGPAGYQQYVGAWLTAFPDARLDVKTIAAGDDFAVAQFTGHGVQCGPFETPAGTLPPTNKSAVVEFCEVYKFVDGRIASTELYFDVLGLLKQLGLA